ncbi:MAG: hypothetical protein K0R14_1706 [Burkholderiales bacterium]|jgi:TrmH family RNA methyltransferase|nr:hypothetical protein [Burkholderiales bacterium]
MNLITSLSNTKIKQIVKLANSRSYRYELCLSIIYGKHLIEEAIKHGLLDSVFINQAKINDYSFITQNISESNIYCVNDEVLSKINLSDSITDIVGLIRMKPTMIDNTVYTNDCVILDNIQDPGNLGTILRSCAAARVKNIVLSKSCVDPYSIKVLRSSQGIQFELNVIIIADIARFISDYKYDVIAAMPNAKDSLYARELSTPCAWLFGNEGSGVSKSLLSNVTHQLTIPMPGKAESLNVAMAATVCLFEMQRQRATVRQ